MVAPLIGAGLISGGASVLGAITGGKAAKSAAKTQQKTAQMVIANNNANRDYVTDLSKPTLDRGNLAGETYAGLLGLGDGAASAKALDTWRGSTGYQDLLKTGLDSVNAGAYARGMGDSGATLKALQAKGMMLANQNQQQYLGNLDNLIRYGQGAIGNITSAATGATQANNAALQNAADARSNATLQTNAGWQNAIQNLSNVGSSFFGNRSAGLGSSYSGFAPMSAPSSAVQPYIIPYGLNPRFA